MAEQRPWHQLFGLSWADFFHGTAVRVEAEKDLSHKQQLLDLVIDRPEGAPLPRLPDGLEDLGRYNALTFKSYQEALNCWVLCELISHYTNLRKQTSPSMDDLLPEDDFHLFAVCVRSPSNLAQRVVLARRSPGVYDVQHFPVPIRVVVIHELPQEPHNAMLLLFSAKQDLVEYGARHFQPHSAETSTLLHQLIARYRKEGLPMPETLEEFARRTRQELLQELTPEEAEQILKRLSPEKRLAGLSAEELLKHLPPETRAELLRRLPAEEGPVKPQ